ncbi:hypothetical protein BZA77DRAFT_321454 [Pyronema omphalodes]|nr:hypothetical protein BZA77DRAFT_321454 [Pyronema omphalodes]
MIPLQQSSSLALVLDTPRGRGIFATRPIPAGSVIDTAPVIILPLSDFDNHIQHTTLLHYSYNWPIPCSDEKKPSTSETLFDTLPQTAPDTPPDTPSNTSLNSPTFPTDDSTAISSSKTLPKTTLTQAIVLGLGSMFNHSVIKQNVGWKRNLEAQTITYTALRDIREGEELLISYGAHLTFEDVDAPREEVVTEEEWLGSFELDG